MIDLEELTEIGAMRAILRAIENDETDDAIDALREIISDMEYSVTHPQASRGEWVSLAQKLNGKGLKIGWFYLVLTSTKWVTVARYQGKRCFKLSNGTVLQNVTHFSYIPYFSTAK